MKQEDTPIDDRIRSEQEEPKSKTRLKKEMLEREKLGMQLTSLPAHYLKKSGIPSELLDAVLSMKTMRTHGARRRQMQRIGVLMREADPGHIRSVIDDFGQPGQTQVSARTKLDELASALIIGTDEHIEGIMRQYPNADRTRLRQLVRNAKDKALHTGQTRGFNALKAYLSEIM
jgi:ribosome-associated protein